MCAPGAESNVAHDYPVAFLEGLYGGADGLHLETAFVAADCGGGGCAEEGGEGGFGGVGALELVYVGGVYGGGEGAEEEGGGGERGGDGVGMEAGLIVSLWKERGRGSEREGRKSM